MNKVGEYPYLISWAEYLEALPGDIRAERDKNLSLVEETI